MRSFRAATLAAAAVLVLPALAQPARPKSGPVEILKSSELRPGMKGYAWTVFAGTEPEPVPVEIIGLWKNAWGPKQDIILAKMGGKALRTNVAGGMSGSPVYIDGKLIGAVALRLSVFSPDAICGITPIELMLEIKDFDTSVPVDARTPDKAQARHFRFRAKWRRGWWRRAPRRTCRSRARSWSPSRRRWRFPASTRRCCGISGRCSSSLGWWRCRAARAAALDSPKPAPGWQKALQPGDAVAGVLVSGDMSITGLGTVTYNDGKRVLAFGHPFFNLGPVDMPMSKGEVLMTLASAFQPNKFANATEIVGALQQDRHSGILGVLGATAAMIPVTVRVRSFDDDNSVRKREGPPLQRLRAAEVDALPDDVDAVQLDLGPERLSPTRPPTG